MRKQHEKKEKEKDEAYYVYRIEDLRKMKLIGNVMVVGEKQSDDGNFEVWSTYLKDHEVRKPTHRAC